MTPELMTPQEQIKYLARYLMEWKILPNGPGFEDCDLIVQEDNSYVNTSWNPLENWNHTMQVWNKIVDFSRHYFVRVVIEAYDGRDCVKVYRDDEGMMSSHGEYDDVTNIKEAICLTAIALHQQYGNK